MRLISPSPARSYILIQFDAPFFMETLIKIKNHEMELVQCLTTSFVKGINEALVNIERLLPGNYILQIFLKEGLLEEAPFNKH